MITIDNYSAKAKNIDFSKLPDVLQKGHDFVKRVTLTFTSKTAYNTSPTIKKAIDGYFSKLDEFLSTSKKGAIVPARKEQPKKESRPIVKQEKEAHKIVKNKKAARHEPKKAAIREDVEWVERIPEELRFMKRYVNLNDKTKTYDQLLTFINSLQRAILEKRIRKTSPYAKQVEYMQKKLIEVYNERKGESILVKIAAKTQTEFLNLINKEKIYNSVQFIKRFISLHGKTGIKEKAKRLYDSMNRAVNRGKLEKSDKYATKLNEIWKLLEAFLKDENQTRLAMDKEELNGLVGLIEDCNCGGLEGIDFTEDEEELGEVPKTETTSHVMNSMDFANMKFNAIGMTGKWLALMGDPSPGFSAMVFGKPKMGKSFLCVELAGYLSRNHGKVLYVAREEGLDATLQKKLNETHVKNENLFMSDNLPDDLSPYKFIFLDSVNKLGLTSADLDKLRKDNPGTSFIFVFQTTKDGNFKGRNEFQHDVDIVIEVYERGKASQFGRYNQGGEMEIFPSEPDRQINKDNN
jgi:hypothetical protein